MEIAASHGSIFLNIANDLKSPLFVIARRFISIQNAAMLLRGRKRYGGGSYPGELCTDSEPYH